MRGAITSLVTRVRQRGDIASIGLDPSAAAPIHRHEIRIRDDDFVAECLQVLRDPLALGRGLQQIRIGGRPQNMAVKRSRVVAMRRSSTSPLSITIRT